MKGIITITDSRRAVITFTASEEAQAKDLIKRYQEAGYTIRMSSSPTRFRPGVIKAEKNTEKIQNIEL